MITMGFLPYTLNPMNPTKPNNFSNSNSSDNVTILTQDRTRSNYSIFTHYLCTICQYKWSDCACEKITLTTVLTLIFIMVISFKLNNSNNPYNPRKPNNLYNRNNPYNPNISHRPNTPDNHINSFISKANP